MKLFRHAATLIVLVFLYSCNSSPDLAAEEQKIKSMLHTERKAHIEKNIDLFVNEFADGMISVNKGKVTIQTIEQHRERIGKYFNSVQFIKWDDKDEPLIRFSDDGSLAYAIVQKEVILNYPDSTGQPYYDTTHYAWTSVYRKHKGHWKVECNISTNK